MKKVKLLLRALPVIVLFQYPIINIVAQNQVVDYLQGGLNDGNIFLGKYFEPFGGMLSTALSSGWYNTAEPHKLGGFDVTFTANIAFTPVSDRTFNINELSLSTLHMESTGDGIAQTIAGKNMNGPELTNDIFTFNSPPGAGMSILPLPIAQAGIGLPFNTEIMVRYLPAFDIKTYSMGLWGVGAKHNIKESIPGLKMLPIDLSVMLGYTRFSIDQAISYGPKTDLINPADEPGLNNQKIELKSGSWTMNLLVSKKLAILTLYGGAGYNHTKTEMGFKGNFPVTITDIADTGYGYSTVIQDPFSLDLNQGGFRVNAGLRLKLTALTIHADYTKVKYPVTTVGLGISFR